MVALSGSPIREIRGKKEPPLPAADYSPVAAPPPHALCGQISLKSVVNKFPSQNGPGRLRSNFKVHSVARCSRTDAEGTALRLSERRVRFLR